MTMHAMDRRKTRKIIEVLKRLRDRYAKEGDTVMSSGFARAMAILFDVLDKDAKNNHERG